MGIVDLLDYAFHRGVNERIPLTWRRVSLGPVGNLSSVWNWWCDGPKGSSKFRNRIVRDSEAELGRADILCTG